MPSITFSLYSLLAHTSIATSRRLFDHWLTATSMAPYNQQQLDVATTLTWHFVLHTCRELPINLLRCAFTTDFTSRVHTEIHRSHMELFGIKHNINFCPPFFLFVSVYLAIWHNINVSGHLQYQSLYSTQTGLPYALAACVSELCGI